MYPPCVPTKRQNTLPMFTGLFDRPTRSVKTCVILPVFTGSADRRLEHGPSILVSKLTPVYTGRVDVREMSRNLLALAMMLRPIVADLVGVVSLLAAPQIQLSV